MSRQESYYYPSGPMAKMEILLKLRKEFQDWREEIRISEEDRKKGWSPILVVNSISMGINFSSRKYGSWSNYEGDKKELEFLADTVKKNFADIVEMALREVEIQIEETSEEAKEWLLKHTTANRQDIEEGSSSLVAYIPENKLKKIGAKR